MLDDRAKLLLNTLVEQYIDQGQPVGSRTLSKASKLDLSAATIRNVMADLEEMGLITSPHTSAGRVPTAQGYRLFVDSILTSQPLSAPFEAHLTSYIEQDLNGVKNLNVSESSEGKTPQNRTFTIAPPQKVIVHAAHILSNLSQFVGVVLAPKRGFIFKHIEFLKLSEKKLLVILVSPDGEVQNRILLTPFDYTDTQLHETSLFLNSHFAGVPLSHIQTQIKQEMHMLQGEILNLMNSAVNVVLPNDTDEQEDIIIVGERNLLTNTAFSNNLDQLRRAFSLFEQKTQLLRLLQDASLAQGVRIYIGGESNAASLNDLSIVSAPYAISGERVGTLAVIGPMRMNYDRMIQIVDITSKLIGDALR